MQRQVGRGALRVAPLMLVSVRLEGLVGEPGLDVLLRGLEQVLRVGVELLDYLLLVDLRDGMSAGLVVEEDLGLRERHGPPEGAS